MSQGANATSAALGALILLLLIGTQVLNWQWTILLPLAAIVAGFYRARRRLPSAYAVAQMVDHRMALADTLSTALFFSQHESHDEPSSRVSGEVRKLQYERADRLSESVDVRKATPYTVPRTAYLMGALILVASSLFALRYGLTRRLDLKAPLASILEQTFGSNERAQQARDNRRLPQPEPQMQPDESGANVQDPDQKAGDQQDSDAANASEEASDTNPAPGEAKAAGGDARKQAEEGEKSDGDQKDAQGDERSGEGESPNGQQGDSKSDPKQDSSAKHDSNGSGDNSSLMSKVKDAMQNLLSRMKPQQGQSGAQQQSAMDQKNSQSKGQQNGSKQQSSKDGQQQNGGQQGDAQEGQSGEQAQNAQDPQGKGTGKSENQQPSKQPGSGIGSQDGDKSIKQAEQLAAMGKISEIFGKRSANITGEATVEVQNTSQQLRTPYAQRGAQHTQAGAEINRDEIPVVLQTYVEQYFEQVRKQQKK
ncbi:MAG: hypothetical protein LAQ69_15620 [Acidobacteriia bacterium]|nr:hypothetical protein [Terriglobia bacterium]